MRLEKRALSICAAALAAIVARQTARADEPAKEPIQVTVRGSQAPAFVTRVSADDRAREAVDAASMLAELPSVHVRRLGADGAQALLSIRGSASTQVGVVLAGIPLTSGADPSMDVGSLPLWPGASFRVYRGFAPASIGTTGHLGGLLVIDPPSPLKGARTEWQTIAGSFGALKVRAGDTRVLGDLKMGVGVFGARAENDFPYEMTNHALGRIVTRARSNAGYVTAGGIGRAALERTWGTVGATIFADAKRAGLPGAAESPTELTRLETTRLVLGADATLRLGDKGASLRALAWGRCEGSRFSDPRGELEPTRTTKFAEQTILAAGGSIGYRGPLGSRRVTIGVFVDARGEEFSPRESLGALGGVAASRVASGLGFELEAAATKDLRLFATGRIDGRRDRATGLDAPSEADGLFPSGHVGASYRLSEALSFAAHAGLLRRLPSFVELYGDRGSLVGDAGLRVERALSADLGVSGALSFGRAAFQYELIGFVSSARDLIVFLPVGIATFRAGNVDEATIAGAEVSASLVAANLRTTVSYTLLGTRNEGEDLLTHGRPLPGRPVHDFSYDASYRVGPVVLRYGVDAVAGTTVDAAATQILPPRFLHGAGLALDVPFARGARLGLEVQNLFDVRSRYVPSALLRDAVAVPVSDFRGFPLPSRTLWASLTYRAP